MRQQDGARLEDGQELPEAVLGQGGQEGVRGLGDLELEDSSIVDDGAVLGKVELEGRVLTLERELLPLHWLRHARRFELILRSSAAPLRGDGLAAEQGGDRGQASGESELDHVEKEPAWHTQPVSTHNGIRRTRMLSLKLVISEARS